MTTKDTFKDRNIIIRLLFSAAALLLTGRAMQLQVLDDTYMRRADATTIESIVSYPSRGLIYDRYEKLMVHNTPVFDLMVTYNQLNPNMDTVKFCQLLKIDKKTFLENIEKNWKDKRFSKNVPFLFLSRITGETFSRFQESLFEFPGFTIATKNIRAYPLHNGANVLGYISEVSPAQIESSDGFYAPADYIGSSGLERTYEKELRGSKGVRNVLKDNLGRIVGPYKDGTQDSSAVAGKDLYTSLDIELQAYGEALMANKRGSIVAIEPATGEILCLVTAPTYDPATLAINEGRGVAFRQLMSDPLKPLFDRSTQAAYPPGSIIKPVVALMALQDGVTSIDRGVSCNGAYRLVTPRKVFQWGCHGHAPAHNVASAIQHSCNTYFFTIFRDIVDKYGYNNAKKGLIDFDNYCYKFGLGQKLGVDFGNERKGRVPTPDIYDKQHKGYNWKSPTIMNIAIGQGEFELTTVQMANLAAIIANKGYFYTPHLIKKFKDGTPIPEQFRKKNRTGINPYYFEPVHQGMEGVITSGTGRRGGVPGIRVCGKTGTSQNPHGEDHSVFFAFAPREDPKIAIAVFVENAGWGNDFAAPISSLMIEKYLKRVTTRPDLEEQAKRPVGARRVRGNVAAIAPGTPDGQQDAPPVEGPDPQPATLPDNPQGGRKK
jgi:penicillin-binding protein 2